MEGDASGDQLSGGVATSDRQHPGAHKKTARAVQAFSAEQQAELEELFEKHGTQKGHIDAITADLAGGVFKRSQVQRQLKEMGLKKGVLTEAQACPAPVMSGTACKASKRSGLLSCLHACAEVPAAGALSQAQGHKELLGAHR